jgi:periplasmic divalent cation tolerance protein
MLEEVSWHPGGTDMHPKYLIIFVTTPTVEEGRKIAQILVGRKLAACVNILPEVTSIYTWQGEVCEDGEVLMIIKTRADLFDALSATVAEEHPYEVPEVIALPLTTGAVSYLNWIDEVTREV